MIRRQDEAPPVFELGVKGESPWKKKPWIEWYDFDNGRRKGEYGRSYYFRCYNDGGYRYNECKTANTCKRYIQNPGRMSESGAIIVLV